MLVTGFLLLYNVDMNKSKRFSWYHGPSFNYRIKWQSYKNPNDDNRYWECEDIWFVSIQFIPRTDFEKQNGVNWLYNYDEWYYDGHTAKSITIMGLRFTKGYTYIAQRIE